MIENIKELWSMTDSKRKDEVLTAISESNEFKSKSKQFIYHRYFANSTIPEEYQPRILSILQNALRIQSAELKSKVEEFN